MEDQVHLKFSDIRQLNILIVGVFLITTSSCMQKKFVYNIESSIDSKNEKRYFSEISLKRNVAAFIFVNNSSKYVYIPNYFVNSSLEVDTITLSNDILQTSVSLPIQIVKIKPNETLEFTREFSDPLIGKKGLCLEFLYAVNYKNFDIGKTSTIQFMEKVNSQVEYSELWFYKKLD